MPWLATMLPGGGVARVSSLTVDNGITMSAGQLLLPDGTTNIPSVGFINDTNLGVFRAGAGNMRFVAGNAFQLIVTAGASQFNGTVIADVMQPTRFKLPFSAVQNITGVGSSVTANSTSVQFSSDGVYTLSSTPQLSAGTNDGQLCYLLNAGSNAVTFSDETSVAGSKLRLGASTRVLGTRDMLVLQWNLAATEWREIVLCNLL